MRNGRGVSLGGEANGGGRRRISVILPCFNGGELLRVQLDALARQAWEDDWELVFVDNGSTDRSVAMAEEYRDRLPNLRIVHAHEPGTVRRGAVHSYRSGVEAASGDAFLFCDADDEVGVDWLAAMADALRTAPFVMCSVDVHRLNPPEILRPQGEEPFERGPLRYPIPPYWEFSLGGTLGFTRTTYETLGPFDERFSFALDTEYCFRAHRAGIPITPVPDALMHYRLRDGHRATFRQRRSWGREYPRVALAYDGDWGRFPQVRAAATLAAEAARGVTVLTAVMLRRPGHRRAAYAWVASMGFAVGFLEGMPNGTGLRPRLAAPIVPPLDAQTGARSEQDRPTVAS
jgi:GT2 family glycosyltransferase